MTPTDVAGAWWTTHTVHFVVPDGIDDPQQPSGGNTYDRTVRDGLAALGWTVCQHPVTGGWPEPDAAALAGLTRVIAEIPDGAAVLIDGIIASGTPEVLVPAARRLRLVVLLHMPIGVLSPFQTVPEPPADGHDAVSSSPVSSLLAAASAEQAVLTAAAAVITTSEWTRRLLLGRYALPAGRIHVATPGASRAEPVNGTATGGRLLCVAAVTPGKGHDILLSGLAAVSELRWHCTCVGSLTRDRDFVARLRRQSIDAGIDARVCFTGPRTGADLHAAYAAADVLVLASRTETYGMVITEALARGIPVIVADVGGTPEAVGVARDGSRPGLLVAPGDAGAFGEAVRDWLGHPELRARLRSAARSRRTTLADWATTSTQISAVLAGAAQ